jgi:superfamily II DNA or RNA helicase
MNAIEITKKLNTALVDYLTTTFDVNKDGKESGLAYEIRKSFEIPKALFNGPFLELILPFKTSLSIQDLISQNVLSEKISSLPCLNLEDPEPIPIDMPLYNHQVKAIRKICEESKSIVISAGTGSGKTECFTLPIVNDILIDDSPGVRALLVYPLNALVNDQLDRLRVLLKDTDITFGRFTGETPDKEDRTENTLPNEIISRDEMRIEKKIPQILITNYAMLEYLLIRPEDSTLFQSGLWKYLVLDEAHTYSGAQGIEVAMLVRRLKERLSKKNGEMICVATSATLINDDAKKAVNFSQELFGEELEIDDIIFGESNIDELQLIKENQKKIPPGIYSDPKFDEIFTEIRKENSDVENIARKMISIGFLEEKDLTEIKNYEGNIEGFLHKVLKSNSEIIKLRDWLIEKDSPVTSLEAAEKIFPELDESDSLEAIYHLIELGALARPGKNQLPLLPAKYHLFSRPPQGIWACINPKCPDKLETLDLDNKWSKIFSTPHEKCNSCGAFVYPINLCRQCGQLFIETHKEHDAYLPASDDLFEEDTKEYFTWSKIQENYALSEDEEDEEAEIIRQKYIQKEIKFCLGCGKDEIRCRCDESLWSISLYNVQIGEKKKIKKEISMRWKPAEKIKECPRCGSTSKGESEIVTPVSVYGTAPLANLTYELFRMLPPSTDPKIKKYAGEGRKLLTFYDSRQGAARFAAYLQDVANKQNYRHIIPKAITNYFEENEFFPSMNGLSEECGKMVVENNIIQNDSDANNFWRKYVKLSSREEKAEIKKWIGAQILGEITTGRRQRQSLESLGLIGVEYFEEDNIPDFEKISNAINLNSEQFKALIGYLLDDLRYRKVVKLPFGIDRDDPVFGANLGNPGLIRQGKTNSWEIPWVGTSRHGRNKYLALILQKNGKDYSDETVERVLTAIWDWLIDETDLFDGSPENGFKLRTERFFFSNNLNWFQCTKCQRFSYRGKSLPCPHLRCEGDLESVDIRVEQNKNYYYKLFNESLIPLRAEEHTAQLDPDKGKVYQNLFKNGNINVLSCSTTFEMGIDLGDLQAVAMSNVPPTVANYRQRSGRAGRRTSGTAFILTWASGRPHDQAYYSEPSEIISGQVAVPQLFLENKFIFRRHKNALLLSLFLRYRQSLGAANLKRCGDFFDLENQEDPQILFLDDWIKVTEEEIKNSLFEFQELLDIQEKSTWEFLLKEFVSDLEKVNIDHYQIVTKYYINQIEELAEKSKDTSTSKKESDNNYKLSGYYRRLLERMRGEFLINYLSNKGVLPSYSFPLHTVELLLPKEARGSENLRLERDLRQAIREYAPGSEIVADKRIWRSFKPLFWQDVARDTAYRICKNCHHLEVSPDAGIPLALKANCSICEAPLVNPQKKFVVPDGFLADSKSGKPAKQYVNIEPSQMRSAILPIENPDEQKIGNFINVAYEREGKLLYVNEGKFGNGFNFSIEGFDLGQEKNKNKNKFSLGHVQTTDTLHIRFNGSETVKVPSKDDQSFWLSLMYAIIHAASHTLQIERRDIDGVLSPRKTESGWEQTIVLYDNVPGGAGYVKNIRDKFTEILIDANRVLNCNDCANDTSCQHCLRDYNNQLFHQDLVREDALKFIEVLLADISPLTDSILGASRVASSNLNMWLLRNIENAQLSLDIATRNIGFGHPKGDNYSWFDTFSNLLSRNCEINLNISEMPDSSPEGMAIAKRLQVLMEKGLVLNKISDIPKWQIIIDKESDISHRVIGCEEENKTLSFENEIGDVNIVTTISKIGVETVNNDFSDMARTKIDISSLDAPVGVDVINLRSSSQQYTTVEELFSKVFEKPCEKMLIFDPYLLNEKQINKLLPYLELGNKKGKLKKVIVHTKKAHDFKEQTNAEKELNKKFKDIIDFKHNATEHDRFIEILREDGEKARIIIGRGLDFMQTDGSIKSTFVVIQDPI